MFKQMKNIDTSFRHIKLFSIVLLCGSFLLCGYVLYKSYALSARVQDRIYILAGDKALEAYASNRKDNVPVEARDHVAMFHQYFFSLDPDDKMIDANISKALYLADASAKKQYDNLKETGYYSNIISGNISQHVIMDSISIDTKVQPYYFRYYGKEKIIRPNSIVTRNLITEGFLRNVARSDHSPHGFLIERWTTLENKDVKTETR
jgi:conjugative transposon TraK protein